MRANCWMGKKKVEVQTVPDPKILNQRDAIVRITSTAICGSDLHLYNGFVPTMESGDILGHEFMGEVMEVGRGVKNLKVGDRVVVPFPISCGMCAPCRAEAYSLCENSNPNAWMAEKLMGHSPAGLFGYSHMLGGYAGGQAEFARVPFADVGPAQDRKRLQRRSGALPVRHFPHRLHGRGDVRDQARRRHRGVGVRTSRTVRDRERISARSRARDCDRPLQVPPRHGAREVRSGDDQLRGSRQRGRYAQRADGRARPRPLHRCGRDGGACARNDVRLRSREAGDDARERSSDRAARGDSRVQERRHGVGDRRVRRLHRQVPHGHRHESVIDDQDGAGARAALHASAAPAHRERRHRSELRHHAPHEARGCATGLRHFREQARSTARRSCSPRNWKETGVGRRRAGRTMLRPFAVRGLGARKSYARTVPRIRWRRKPFRSQPRSRATGDV